MEHDQLPTEYHSQSPSESPTSFSPYAPYVPARDIRKARRKEKRYLNQVERTRIREHLQAGLRDPECFLDLEARKKNTHRLLSSGAAERRLLLEMQLRKVKSELGNTRDLDTFIQKTSRSRTLYALIGLGFFRDVLRSEEYRDDHRYKLAIRRALEEPGLAKSIQRKWDCFDKEFPSRLRKQTG
jgi:hypothetical protein